MEWRNPKREKRALGGHDKKEAKRGWKRGIHEGNGDIRRKLHEGSQERMEWRNPRGKRGHQEEMV